MSFKKTIFASLLIAGIGAPSLASAVGIEIFNNTNFPSTSRINGKCSTELLPADGVTPKGGHKNITDFQLRVACGFRPDNCVAEVYVTPNCTGPVITTVKLTVAKGIYDVSKPILGYTQYHTATYMQLNGPKE